MAQFAQPCTDLATAPGWMGLTNCHDGLLHGDRGAPGRGLRPARLIGQAVLAVLCIALEQLVGRCRADGKTAA